MSLMYVLMDAYNYTSKLYLFIILFQFAIGTLMDDYLGKFMDLVCVVQYSCALFFFYTKFVKLEACSLLPENSVHVQLELVY